MAEGKNNVVYLDEYRKKQKSRKELEELAQVEADFFSSKCVGCRQEFAKCTCFDYIS